MMTLFLIGCNFLGQVLYWFCWWVCCYVCVDTTLKDISKGTISIEESYRHFHIGDSDRQFSASRPEGHGLEL